MPSGVQDDLQELLDEILTVASVLKKSISVSDRSVGISFAARALLHRLGQQPGMTVPQLARQRGTSRQNMQALADRLSAAGQVQFVANPDHRRSERLLLTPAGKRSLHTTNRRQAILLKRVSSHVTEKELKSCLAVLRRLETHLGDLDPTSPLPTDIRRSSQSTKVTTSVPDVAEPVAESVEKSVADLQSPEELPVTLL